MEAPVDEVELALGDGDTEEGFALMAEPLPEAGVYLEGTGLYAEYEDVAPEAPEFFGAPRAVSAAEAVEGDIGENVHWTLSADGVLRISGQGNVEWAEWENESYPAVRELVVGEGITALPESGFFESATLEAVTLPSTLEKVGYADYYKCAKLRRAIIGGGTEIGDYAFQNCSSLVELTLPRTLRSIGIYAFAGTAVTSLTLPQSIEAMGVSAFGGVPLTSLVIEDGAKLIGDYAFSESKLTSLTLPDSVESIGNNAFGGAPIETLKLGMNVKTIGNYAFSGTKLTSLTLPDSVRTVGGHAFTDVPIETLSLGKGVMEIGEFAFAWTQLTVLTIPASVQRVGDAAFTTDSLRTVTFLGTPALEKGVVCSGESGKELLFLGGVPTFQADTFADTVAVAVYPGGDPAWTKDVCQQYGGNVVWVDADTAPEETDARAATEKLKAETGYYGYINVVDNGDGTYTRAIPTDGGIVVEICDSATDKLTWKKTVKRELPLWGGFFSGRHYNFLVFGQKNVEEDNGREVVRVVRYTKNWNRLDAASVNGANTVEPFGFGNVTMTESGDMLYFHTCHVMYADPNGINHQASFDFDVYVPTMQITTVRAQVDRYGTGYVSHSLGQCIARDGDDVIQMDLGDGYPRSLIMFRWKEIGGSLVKAGSKGESLEAMAIASEIGDNYTGIQLAGLEASKDRYLAAGVSVSQKGKNPSGPQNLFVLAVSKADFTPTGVELRWLTDYSTDDKRSLSDPELVKLNDDSMLLMWTENDARTRYMYLDGAGRAASRIYALKGARTGGKPMLRGGEVRWTYNDGGTQAIASIAAGRSPEAPEIKSVAATEQGVRVEWSAVNGASGYYVMRRSEGSEWKQVATVKDNTFYVDTKAVSGEGLHYTVMAYSGESKSGFNDAGRSVTWLAAPALKSAVTSKDGVRVKWGKVAGAKGYCVYRCASGAKWKKIATVDDKTGYLDTEIRNGQEYRYTVRAYDSTFTSGCEEPGLAAMRLSTPELKSATATGKGIRVKWGKVTGAKGYCVYRRVSGAKWKKLAAVNSATSYVDASARSGVEYHYTVKACNGDVISACEARGRSAVWLSKPVLASVVNTAKGIRVKWKKVAGAKGYTVYRRAEGGKWKKLATVGGKTSYTDTACKSGKQYRYTVKAYSGTFSSDRDPSGLGTMWLAKPKPRSVSATTKGIRVKWGKVAGAKGYTIYRRVKGGKWKKLANVKGKTQYLDKKAAKGKAYQYRLMAFSGDSTSAYSAATKAKKP